MKKVIYSKFTKIFISILCIFSISYAVNIAIEGYKQWNDYKVEVYMFDDEFENSKFLSDALNRVSYDMYNAAVQYANDNSFNVKDNLENNIDRNRIDYYLSIDNKTFSNKNDLKKDHKYYFKLEMTKEHIEQDINPYVGYFYLDPYQLDSSEINGHNVEIYIGLQEQYVNTIHDLWTEQKTLFMDTVNGVVYGGLVPLLCIIYLILVIGKDKEGNLTTHLVDHINIEFKLLIMLGVLVLGGYLSLMMLNQYHYGYFPYDLLKLCIQIVVTIVFSVLLTLFLSIIRNLKNKTFLSNFLLFVIIKKIFNIIKHIINEVSEVLANHMNIIVIGLFFIYTTCIGLLGHASYLRAISVVMGFILFLVASYFVIKYLNTLNRIKEGVNNIRNGDLNYKIEDVPFKDLSNLKEGINDMSSGLKESVNKTLKAERLKTELITNVSHDLKTPLTSIINYTKLLSDVEGLPEEAKDYVAIIDKKSQRLKALTQDLFDISKVQSGNEEIIIEKLNVETLLSQSLAEYEKELENLTVCTKIEEGLTIYSDGRKMSRVINNLLINITKYTLPNTRVFIDAYSKDNKAFIEMKNISSYPLDFDKDEIMQRFKRGDESRTEEGHGLGLAIVKSYVEVTGGKFDIILDGDLFKAVIEYDKK